MMSFKCQQNTQKGFTLTEIIVYMALVLTIVVGSVNALLSYAEVVDMLRVRTQLAETAQGALERITREVRNANEVDVAGSDLVKATSTLSLIGDEYDTIISGTTTQLMISRDGGADVPLNSGNITLDSFYVYHYTAVDVEMLRMVLTMSSQSGDRSLTETFTSSVVLRGSYE